MEIPRHWRLKKQRIGFDELELNPVKKAGSMKNAIARSSENVNRGLLSTCLRIIIYESDEKKYESLDEIKI